LFVVNVVLGAFVVLFGACLFWGANSAAKQTSWYNENFGKRTSPAEQSRNARGFRLVGLVMIVFGVLTMFGVCKLNLTQP